MFMALAGTIGIMAAGQQLTLLAELEA